MPITSLIMVTLSEQTLSFEEAGQVVTLLSVLIPTYLLNKERLLHSTVPFIPFFSQANVHTSHPSVAASNTSTFSAYLLGSQISHIPPDYMPVSATPV